MVYLPGTRRDLDTLTDKAIKSSTPDLFIEEVESVSTKGVPLLVAACIQGRLDLAELLLDAGATATTDDLAHVIWWGSGLGPVTFLLEHGVTHDATCLRNAAHRERWEIVLALIDRGADLETEVFFSMTESTSLLHTAARQGASSVVRALLNRAMDADRRDSQHYTPLLKACDFVDAGQKTDAESVYWLLKHGADPNAILPTGETPLVFCLGKHFGTLDPMDYFSRVACTSLKCFFVMVPIRTCPPQTEEPH